MIDVKQAIELANASALSMLGAGPTNLEEIERDEYKSHDVWAITLSIPRDLALLSAFPRSIADPLKDKRFLIDAQTGELLAMKVREIASR